MTIRIANGGDGFVEERPRYATDTVVVKLKSAAAPRTARKALRAPADATLHLGGLVDPVLHELVQNGIVAKVSHVFDGEGSTLDVGRRPTRAAAKVLAVRKPVLRKSRGLVTLRVDRGTDAKDLAQHLAAKGDRFEYAYVPAIKYPCARSTKVDPLAARQWGHAAIRLHEARNRRRFHDAKDILVAVLDTGIDADHPDLKGAIHAYVNFTGETDKDVVGHGTHVSGIIAALRNNAIGISGVCRAKLVAIKALPTGRWNAGNFYRALAHPIEAGAKVVNFSLGGEFDPAERDIIEDLLDAGIVVVAAMGNEYEEGNPTSYPAAYPGVIAVGACDEVDRRASFSNTGGHIALMAPGVNVLSTVPTYPAKLAEATDYDSWPGTSMATPHVAAAAALLLTKHSDLTPAKVRTALMRTARKIGRGRAFSERYGAGMLDVHALLA